MTSQEKLDLLEDLIYGIGSMLDEAHSINTRGALHGQLDSVTKALGDALSDANSLANDLRGQALAESERELAALQREYWVGVRM